MLGLSTSWKSEAVGNGEELLLAMEKFGIDGVELDYRLTVDVFHQLKAALKHSHLRVFSLHNVCPKPSEKAVGGEREFFLSDTDREKRTIAVNRTINTIEKANDLEARIVVLHCGHVDMDADLQTLYGYHQRGLLASAEAGEAIQKKTSLRDKLKAKHLESILFSLDSLIPVAEKQNVLLALENRYHYHELPTPDDFDLFFSEFSGAPIGYWHDCGHAHANEIMGFVEPGQLSKRYSNHLLGFHLHDAVGLDDHLPPGAGEIGFSDISTFSSKPVPMILELKPGTTDDAVSQGIHFTKRRILSPAG